MFAAAVVVIVVSGYNVFFFFDFSGNDFRILFKAGNFVMPKLSDEMEDDEDVGRGG